MILTSSLEATNLFSPDQFLCICLWQDFLSNKPALLTACLSFMANKQTGIPFRNMWSRVRGSPILRKRLRKLRDILSSNGKTADIYCLQMVQPLTCPLFKWQKRWNLFSSNDKPAGTYGQTVNTYSLQTAKMSHLLSSNGKTVTSALFKWQNRQNLLSSNGETVNTYCHQTVKQSTPIIFKRQNCHI